jgi:hypothetical protein
MAWQTPKTNWGQPGQTVPGADDFNRIEGNIDILGKYDRAPGYGTATGTNTKNITLSPAPSSYYEGLCFAFKNSVENTGAVTINVNGMGAKSVKKPNGNDLVSGNLKAGSVYTVRYNGTNFILQGSDSSGDAMPEHVLAGKTFSNDANTGITGSMPNQGKKIFTPTTTNIAIPQGYHDGTGYVVGSANLIPSNIKKGVNIFNTVGTFGGFDRKNKSTQTINSSNSGSGTLAETLTLSTFPANLGGLVFRSNTADIKYVDRFYTRLVSTNQARVRFTLKDGFGREVLIADHYYTTNDRHEMIIPFFTVIRLGETGVYTSMIYYIKSTSSTSLDYFSFEEHQNNSFRWDSPITFNVYHAPEFSGTSHSWEYVANGTFYMFL